MVYELRAYQRVAGQLPKPLPRFGDKTKDGPSIGFRRQAIAFTSADNRRRERFLKSETFAASEITVKAAFNPENPRRRGLWNLVQSERMPLS
jgi:hypothetical protein